MTASRASAAPDRWWGPGTRRPRPAGSARPAVLALCVVLGAGLGTALVADAGPAGLPAPDTKPAGPAGLPAPDAEPVGRHLGCRVDCPAAPHSTAGRATAGPPTRVRIPRIRVDSTLARLRLDRSGRLAAPTDFAEAGWFADGPAPGDVGPAVLAGHVDSRTGPAVFHRLSELRPGDRIEVRRNAGWVPFRVTGSHRYAKDDFPTATVYGPTPGAELRLITCDGVFDRAAGHYRDNLVVFAVADLPVLLPGSAAG